MLFSASRHTNQRLVQSPLTSVVCCSHTTHCYLAEAMRNGPSKKASKQSKPPSHAFVAVSLFFSRHKESQQFQMDLPHPVPPSHSASALKCRLATCQSVSGVICVMLPCTESPGSLQASACRWLAVCCLFFCFFIALLLLLPLPRADSTVGTLCSAFKITGMSRNKEIISLSRFPKNGRKPRRTYFWCSCLLWNYLTRGVLVLSSFVKNGKLRSICLCSY